MGKPVKREEIRKDGKIRGRRRDARGRVFSEEKKDVGE